MIVYLDTSAMVPLLVTEPTSDACGELWDSADRVTATRLAYVEAVAALAMATRLRRISTEQAREGRGVLDDLWPSLDVIELDDVLVRHAAEWSVTHGLRGYDAVHGAAAFAANDAELVAASGDLRLLTAWRAEGVATRNTHT